MPQVATYSRWVPRSTSSSLSTQTARKIPRQIVRIFESNREAQQAFTDTGGRTRFG